MSSGGPSSHTPALVAHPDSPSRCSQPDKLAPWLGGSPKSPGVRAHFAWHSTQKQQNSGNNSIVQQLLAVAPLCEDLSCTMSCTGLASSAAS